MIFMRVSVSCKAFVTYTVAFMPVVRKQVWDGWMDGSSREQASLATAKKAHSL